MPDLSFPITGAFRTPMLFMEWIFVVLAFNVCFIFILKYKRQDRDEKQKQELGFASLFAGFGSIVLFFIVGDYFATETEISPFLWWPVGTTRDLVTNIGYIFGVLCILAFMIIMEGYRRYVMNRRWFSIVYASLFIPYFVIFTLDMQLSRELSPIFVVLFGLFMLIFLVDLGRNVEKRKGGVATPILLTTFFTAFAGFFFTFDIAGELFGQEIRILGASLLVAAFVAFFLVFIQLPSLASLDWKKLIDFVLIFDKGGMCMLQRAYIEHGNKVDENLVSGALSTVGSILEEMTRTERGLSAIKKRGKVVTMYSSELVTGTIVGNDENEFLARKLKNFIQTFESIYRNDIITWKGESGSFDQIKSWMDATFS